MKIILPLAGKGTRLLPHTQNTPKPLIYVAGKGILDYLMEQLIPLQASEFVFITGYLKEQIERHMKDNYPQVPIRFIEQKDPQGLGHAIYQARDAFNKDEDMLVVLGDQTFTINWLEFLNKKNNCISVVKVENPSAFGIVQINENGLIIDMEEKPNNPKSNLAISGTYYFPSAQSVFATIGYQIAQDIRTKGEIQITDSMKIMMEQGEKFETLEINDWNDCGNHQDLLQANQTLLQKNMKYSCFDSSVKIIGPVWIDNNVSITNSVIGPNVSIAKDAIISNSTIKNSVINQKTSIKDSNLSDSYIGQDCNLNNISGKDKYLIKI